MTLKDIVAKIGELETNFKELFKARAEDVQVIALKEAVAGMRETVAGQLTQLTADLETARATIKTVESQNLAYSAEATANTNALNEAIASLKLDVKTDATSAEKIKAIADGVASTLSKLNVTPGSIPQGKTTTGSTAAARPSEQELLNKLNAITDPVERVKFIKSIRK